MQFFFFLVFDASVLQYVQLSASKRLAFFSFLEVEMSRFLSDWLIFLWHGGLKFRGTKRGQNGLIYLNFFYFLLLQTSALIAARKI